MKKIFAVAAAAAMLAGLGGVAGAAPHPKATGGVGFTTGGGSEAKASFNGHGTVPAKGQVDVKNHDGLNFRGEVDCYHQSGPDDATLTGHITSFSGTDDNGQGTSYFRIRVHDGGTPGRNGDRITINRNGATAFDCTDAVAANRPVSNGNLVVH